MTITADHSNVSILINLVHYYLINRHTVTLTFIGQCPMSNSSELFSYTTNYVQVSCGLNHYFFSYHVHTQTHTHTHARTHTHTHRQT